MLLQSQPPGFQLHSYEFEVATAADNESVWAWLNDPKTFTDTQYWPFKVEFYSPNPTKIPNGFHEGVLTNHHGPLLNLAGELIEIKPLLYRDLQYFYGSYALSFRWIRPYRLEFSTEVSDSQVVIHCMLSSYVKPWIANLWTGAQRLFWSGFKGWSQKSITKIVEQKRTQAAG